MVTLENRLQAFEKQHQYDEELTFLINARAAHKLGAWAARTMRMSEDQIETFIHSEVFDYLARRGMAHVMQFVSVKMKENGIHLSDYVMQRQKDRFVKEARMETMQMRFHPKASSASKEA